MDNLGKNYAKKKQLDSFKTRLRMIMAEKGVTGTDVSKNLNINKSVVSQWMNGRNFPNNERVEQLANYLQVSSDYLVGADVGDENAKEETQYSIPDSINTFEEARDFLKSLNLYAYGGIDLNQKSESDIITLARTILSTLQIQGKL